MIFKDPWILIFIPVVIAVGVFYQRKNPAAAFRFSTTTLFSRVPGSLKMKIYPFFFIFRLIVLTLFLIALAGPRLVLEETKSRAEGIDIILAVDSSGSMAAEDFLINGQRYNRLHVVKEVVKEFMEARPHDRIGLIAFAGRAYTVCPLTIDHDWLKANLKRVELGLLEDGTAIGSAISSSLLRLKDSTAKSKVVVLLTDGVQNAGKIDPLAAARAARSLGIKIYTIGAGSQGYAPFPVEDFWGRKRYQRVRIDLDEKVLKEVADITQAKYFRATDTESLKTIYQEIDRLEKVEIETVGYKEYTELFGWLVYAALLILLTETVLGNTLFLKIP